MPYRHAHYWLLAVLILIPLSFWESYFGHIGSARLGQHLHGLTATAWLVLLMLQSWSIHAGRPVWHRASGLAVFAVVPLFAAAGIYGVRDMSAEMNAGAPFQAFSAPLVAPDDLMSVFMLVGFVAAALATRRNIHRHAAWMLATGLMVVPPMTTRLVQAVLNIAGLDGPSFFVSFCIGEFVTIAAALALAYRRPREAKPFLVLSVLILMQIAGYVWLGPLASWRATLATFGASPPWPSALAAGLLALVTLILAWRTVPTNRRTPSGAPTKLEVAV